MFPEKWIFFERFVFMWCFSYEKFKTLRWISQLHAKPLCFLFASYFSNKKVILKEFFVWFLKISLFMTSFPFCFLWRACCSAKMWNNVRNSGVLLLLHPQKMTDPLEEKKIWFKTQDLSSWNFFVGFCLCDLVQIIEYWSWEMYWGHSTGAAPCALCISLFLFWVDQQQSSHHRNLGALLHKAVKTKWFPLSNGQSHELYL